MRNAFVEALEERPMNRPRLTGCPRASCCYYLILYRPAAVGTEFRSI
jgi:hypothetical protein